MEQATVTYASFYCYQPAFNARPHHLHTRPHCTRTHPNYANSRRGSWRGGPPGSAGYTRPAATGNSSVRPPPPGSDFPRRPSTGSAGAPRKDDKGKGEYFQFRRAEGTQVVMGCGLDGASDCGFVRAALCFR